jgi:hypothetical protein
MARNKTVAGRRKPKAVDPRVRALRFFEQCELGLVKGYRAIPADRLPRGEAARLAVLHASHATLIRDLLRRDGDQRDSHPYELWAGDPTPETMQAAELSLFTTYRDHLTTVGRTAMHMIRTRIMPDPYRAVEQLAKVTARRRGRTPRLIHALPPKSRALGRHRRKSHGA